MVIACQVKEILICTELRKMAEIGLVPAATAEDLIKQKFEFPLPRGQDDDDPFEKCAAQNLTACAAPRRCGGGDGNGGVTMADGR